MHIYFGPLHRIYLNIDSQQSLDSLILDAWIQIYFWKHFEQCQFQLSEYLEDLSMDDLVVWRGRASLSLVSGLRGPGVGGLLQAPL